MTSWSAGLVRLTVKVMVRGPRRPGWACRWRSQPSAGRRRRCCRCRCRADGERGLVGAALVIGGAVEHDRERLRRLEHVVVEHVDGDVGAGLAGQNGDGAGAGVAEVAAGNRGAIHQVIGDGDVVVGRIGQADRKGDGAALGGRVGRAVGDRNRRLVVVDDVAGAGVGGDAERGLVGAALVIGGAVELDRERLRQLEHVVVEHVDGDVGAGLAGQNGDRAGAGVAEVGAGNRGAVHQVIGDGDVVVGRIGQADRKGDGGVGALGGRVGRAVGDRNRRLVVVDDVAGAGVGADAERGLVGAALVIGGAVELDRERLRRLEHVVVESR